MPVSTGLNIKSFHHEAGMHLLPNIKMAERPTRSLCARFAFLILTSFGSVGIYFGYNMTGAITQALRAPPYNMDSLFLGSLVAAYSFPNVIFPLVGGMLTDKLGLHLASVMYSSIIVLGAFGFWVSLSINMDHSVLQILMMSSMIVFGIGSESTTVVQKAMLASWFKDSKDFPRLGFAISLALTFGYVGIIINRWSVPALLVHGVPAVYKTSTCVCLVSCLSLVIASWMHKCDESVEGARTVQDQLRQGSSTEVDAHQEVAPATISGKLTQFVKRVTQLPWTFFILSAMLSFTSPLFASFETFGSDVMVQVWDYDMAQADEITSFVQIAGLVLMPSISMIYDTCDKTGRLRICGASLGSIILSSSWFVLVMPNPSLASNATPYLGTLGVALGSAMFFGGAWSCVPLLVKGSHVGTAFGLMTAMQNTALSITLVVDGKLQDATGSFVATGILLGCQGAISALLGLVMLYLWPYKDMEYMRHRWESNSWVDEGFMKVAGA